jgi:hypothetical protein
MPKVVQMKYPAMSLNSGVFFCGRYRVFEKNPKCQSKSRQIESLSTVALAIQQTAIVVLCSSAGNSISELDGGSLAVISDRTRLFGQRQALRHVCTLGLDHLFKFAAFNWVDPIQRGTAFLQKVGKGCGLCHR